MHVQYRTSLAVGLLLAVLAAFPAGAQQSQGQRHTMPEGGAMMGMHGPAMQSAMERMQQGMGASMSGDPDVDFATMMIPHHQGAIDMARSELEHGKDPELRRLAEKIIADQEREIAELKDWLARHPAKQPPRRSRPCARGAGNMPTLSRRHLLASAAALALTHPAFAAASELEEWKMRACGCCAGWAKHFEAAGFRTVVHEVDDVGDVRAAAGVPADLGGCHTSRVAGYVVEGHVPVAAVQRLLAERPASWGSPSPACRWARRGWRSRASRRSPTTSSRSPRTAAVPCSWRCAHRAPRPRVGAGPWRTCLRCRGCS
jgi:hypothetical protein